MANNQYTWTVDQLDCVPSANGLTNVVQTVHWRVVGTDGNNHTASAYSTQSLNPPTPGSFTPYSNLVANQVIGWVHDAMGANAVSTIYTNIDTAIANLINPPIIYPSLPWAANT